MKTKEQRIEEMRQEIKMQELRAARKNKPALNTYVVIGPYGGKKYLVQAENFELAQDRVTALYPQLCQVHSVELLPKSAVAAYKRRYFDELTVLPPKPIDQAAYDKAKGFQAGGNENGYN